MTRHRTIIPLFGLLLALCLAVPVAAQANPILSGYGGPGQGNQAILGSALLNGPSSGGGGGGSAGSGASGESGSLATPTSAGSGRAGRGAASKQSPAHGQSGAAAGTVQRIVSSHVDASSAYLAAERGHAVGQSGALGLTGQDLLLMILVLAALALAAVFTRRLTQPTAAGTQR
jgi:hypothetical protein